jgi:hypothetical protein
MGVWATTTSAKDIWRRLPMAAARAALWENRWSGHVGGGWLRIAAISSRVISQNGGLDNGREEEQQKENG